MKNEICNNYEMISAYIKRLIDFFRYRVPSRTTPLLKSRHYATLESNKQILLNNYNICEHIRSFGEDYVSVLMIDRLEIYSCSILGKENVERLMNMMKTNTKMIKITDSILLDEFIMNKMGVKIGDMLIISLHEYGMNIDSINSI